MYNFAQVVLYFINAHCANSSNIKGRPLFLTNTRMHSVSTSVAFEEENCYIIIDVIVISILKFLNNSACYSDIYLFAYLFIDLYYYF
jgi:hypothetical protein